MSSPKKSSTEIPAVLKFWKGLNDGLPSISLPLGPSGKPLSFTVSILSSVILAGVNLLARHFLIHSAGFPNGAKITKETGASFAGVFHSSNLLVGLVCLFVTQKYSPSGKMSEASEWWQRACDAVISFCIGYMIYDGLFIFLTAHQEGTGLTADDITFLAHHLMTTTYMMQTRMLGAGHMSAMICMFLGEFTNPFHNGYYILQNTLSLECCQDIAWVRSLDYANTFVFAALYVVIRSVIGPVTLLHTSYDLIRNGRSNGIPIWIITLWLILIWGVVYGSIPWVQTTWGMLLTYFPSAAGDVKEL